MDYLQSVFTETLDTGDDSYLENSTYFWDSWFNLYGFANFSSYFWNDWVNWYDYYGYTDYYSYYDYLYDWLRNFDWLFGDRNNRLDDVKIYRDISLFLNREFAIILWIISLPNILVVYILQKKNNRNSSTAIYLTSLAIADILATTTICMRGIVELVNSQYPSSDLQCKVEQLILLGFIVSPWTQSIISIERALSVVKPLKIKLLCTAKRTKIIVIITWVCVLGFIASEMYVTEQREPNDFVRLPCYIRTEMYEKYYHYTIYFNMAVVFILPLGIIFVCSVVIAKVLLFSKSVGMSKSSQSSRRQVTVFIFIRNVVFIVTSTPYIALYIYGNVNADKLYDAIHAYKVTELFLSFKMIAYINYAANFYLYFLAGSRFRQEIYSLFKKK